MNTSKVWVVIAAYNEEQVIGQTVAQVLERVALELQRVDRREREVCGHDEEA